MTAEPPATSPSTADTAAVGTSLPAAVEIVPLDAEALEAHRHALGDLLVDTVRDGASVGFLAALDRPEAAAWWQQHAAAVADGSRLLWIARAGDRVLGTVTLVPESKANGRHRAEIVKLMVHSDARGRGIARRLLETAEHAARSTGITLLLLDTKTDSPAEHLYRATGWTAYGLLPDHAAEPDGTLAATTFYCKPLT